MSGREPRERRARTEGEERLLSSLFAAGLRVEKVVLTENVRVMASLADRGRTLRLHRIFLEAPAPVQRAVGTLFSAPSTTTRSAARRSLTGYLRAHAPTPPSPAHSPEAPAPTDLPHLERLRKEFEQVNTRFFGDALPQPLLRLSGRMRRRNGHFRSHPLEIAISRALCEEAEAGEAEQTLRHEMIHLWQFVQGRRPGHGPDFRAWALRLDVHPRATRTVCWLPDSERAAGEVRTRARQAGQARS